MKSRIVDWWIQIRASYWFIPSVMAIGAIVAAVGLVQVDDLFGAELLMGYEWFYANQPAGARSLLSTVAGSMITVAGVTFSMTLLAVSHASAQIGPRLLAGFMRDRGNQLTLGTFIATFLYCLVVLRTVHAGGSATETAAGVFVPHLAILVAVLLAVVSVAVLIYFFHHVPQSINVSNVIARVGGELLEGICCLYPDRVGAGAPEQSDGEPGPERPASNGKELRVTGAGGYLRVLDAESLLEIAKAHDLIVQVEKRPGDFAVTGQLLLRAGPAESVDEDVEAALRGVFSWGIQRTPEQDVMFPAEQLLEVFGKAMSPGINGQYTALLCLNQFERALAELLQRSVPDECRFDADGNLRIVARTINHEDFVQGIMRPVRQYARGDWIVTNHLLRMFDRLMQLPQLRHKLPLMKTERSLIEGDVADSAMSETEKRLLLPSDNATPAG